MFPASGLRDRTNGGLNNSPSNGYYWSSSPNSSGSTNGGNLNFNNSGTVNPQNNNNRANGFSVRCVSEVTGKKNCVLCLCLYLWHLFPLGEASALFFFLQSGVQ